jgi:hypothetical protein
VTGASGPGVWPGTDPLESLLTILGDLSAAPTGVTGLPFFTQLPGRGPGSEPIARTALLLPEMPVELGPHGWRLADHPGVDANRAEAFLREDLDALAIAGAGYSGPLTVQVVGPWTLAATLYLARGDRVLSDLGAVHALVGALAEGIGQVAAGVVPSFSGYSRLRAVRGPEILEGIEPVVHAVRAAGARSVVHVGQVWDAVPPVVLSGADAVGLEVASVADGAWDPRGWELLARAVERGTQLWAGLPPATVSQCAGADVRGLADLVSVPWRRMGLPADGLADVVLTSSGSAATWTEDRTPDRARGALGTVVRAAEILAERAGG